MPTATGLRRIRVVQEVASAPWPSPTFFISTQRFVFWRKHTWMFRPWNEASNMYLGILFVRRQRARSYDSKERYF